MKQSVQKIFIAGGGTGGHIYPAMAIAESLRAQAPDVVVEFVGTPYGLESKIIPKAGYKLHLIQSGKLNFSGQIFTKIKTLIKLPIGLIQSFVLILKNRPVYVLGVGGYASAPMLLAAALCGRRTALWEPNAHSGMANRILSYLVPKAYLVFKEAQLYLKSSKVLVLGMPLRSEIEKARQKTNESEKNHSHFTLLCFGGSQGSVFLNDQLSSVVLAHPEWSDRLRVIHQTGSLDYQRMLEKYKDQKHVQVFEYIYDMPQYYEKADLLFCRGGASTLAEAAAFGLVPIVVPLPAADDHQQKNAESLVQAGAGFMQIQKQFSKTDFEKTIQKMMDQPQELKQMSDRLRKLSSLNAALEIAKDILHEIRKS